MNLSSIDGILWGISLAGQLLVLAVLIKQRLYRMFPLFCAYIGYASLSDITVYALYARMSGPIAFRLYCVNAAFEFCLQIGIFLEIGWIVLNPVKRSLPRASIYFLGAMLVIALSTALLLSMHSQPTQVDRWARYLVYVSFAGAILRLTIFGVIAGFSQMLGIGWKNHVFQIATGLVAYSISILLVELLHRMTGVGNQPLYHFHDQFPGLSPGAWF